MLLIHNCQPFVIVTTYLRLELRELHVKFMSVLQVVGNIGGDLLEAPEPGPPPSLAPLLE